MLLLPVVWAACHGSTVKTVEIVPFVDCSLKEKLGPCLDQFISAVLLAGNDIFLAGDASPGFPCPLRLAALPTFTWGCSCSAGNNGQTSGFSYPPQSGKVSPTGLHASFRSWQAAQRSIIEAKIGRPYDLAVLFTGEALADDVIGQADVGTLCSSAAALLGMDVVMRNTNVELSCTNPRGIGLAGNLLAHEVAHTMAALHESSGCPQVVSDSPEAIMCPTLSTSPSSRFSSKSRGEIASWFSSGSRSCLDNTPASGGTFGDICGDGRISGCEECDPGLDINDPCCNENTCQLVSGCECTPCNHDCCTTSGDIKSAGVVCRANGDVEAGECDVAEQCDGSSPYCPVDVRLATGTLCRAATGRCYKSNCEIGLHRIPNEEIIWYAEPCDVRSGADMVQCRDMDTGEIVSESQCSAQPRPVDVCCPSKFPPTPSPPTRPPTPGPPTSSPTPFPTNENGVAEGTPAPTWSSDGQVPTPVPMTNTASSVDTSASKEVIGEVNQGGGKSALQRAWQANAAGIVVGSIAGCCAFLGCIAVAVWHRRRAGKWIPPPGGSLRAESETVLVDVDYEVSNLSTAGAGRSGGRRSRRASQNYSLSRGDVDDAMATGTDELDVNAAKAKLLAVPLDTDKHTRRSRRASAKISGGIRADAKVHVCKLCSKQYETKELLLSHIQLRHADESTLPRPAKRRSMMPTGSGGAKPQRRSVRHSVKVTKSPVVLEEILDEPSAADDKPRSDAPGNAARRRETRAVSTEQHKPERPANPAPDASAQDSSAVPTGRGSRSGSSGSSDEADAFAGPAADGPGSKTPITSRSRVPTGQLGSDGKPSGEREAGATGGASRIPIRPPSSDVRRAQPVRPATTVATTTGKGTSAARTKPVVRPPGSQPRAVTQALGSQAAPGASKATSVDSTVPPTQAAATSGTFACRECDKQYPTNELLVAHQEIRHRSQDVTVGAPAPGRPASGGAGSEAVFRCVICDNKSYPTKALLVSHMELRHDDEPGGTPGDKVDVPPSYSCPEATCHLTAPCGAELQRHVVASHGYPREECCICGKGYPTEEAMHAHHLLRHK